MRGNSTCTRRPEGGARPFATPFSGQHLISNQRVNARKPCNINALGHTMPGQVTNTSPPSHRQDGATARARSFETQRTTNETTTKSLWRLLSSPWLQDAVNQPPIHLTPMTYATGNATIRPINNPATLSAVTRLVRLRIIPKSLCAALSTPWLQGTWPTASTRKAH